LIRLGLCGKIVFLSEDWIPNLKFIKNYFLEKWLNARLFFMGRKPELTDFINKLKQINKIMVIVPRDRAQEVVARKYITMLKDAFPGAKISKIDVFNLRKTDINWIGAPNEQFIEQFRKENFDLSIDFNSYHDALCSYLCALTEAAIRMHICEGKFDKIYNLHIRTNSNTSLERRYTQLLTKLINLAQAIRKAPAV